MILVLLVTHVKGAYAYITYQVFCWSLLIILPIRLSEAIVLTGNAVCLLCRQPVYFFCYNYIYIREFIFLFSFKIINITTIKNIYKYICHFSKKTILKRMIAICILHNDNKKYIYDDLIIKKKYQIFYRPQLFISRVYFFSMYKKKYGNF